MTISKFYGLSMKSAFNKEIDFDTNTIKVALCSSTYSPNQDTHQYFSSITNELSGGGYSQQTLTGKTVNYDAGSNTFTLDAADATFTSLTAADIRYAIVFVDTGSSATSALIGYIDFEANQSATAQDFTVIFNASGIAAITVS